MNFMRHTLRYVFPALFWGALIFFESSIPGTRLPSFARLINDKVVHAAIYCVFGLLIYRALATREAPNAFSWRRSMIAVTIVVLYGLSDEFHQGFVPGRTKDILDAAADTGGGLLSMMIVWMKSRLQSEREG